MKLFDKLSRLKPESDTVEVFEATYDQLRQDISGFLNQREIRGYLRGSGRDEDTTEFEDLLIGADVLFCSLKAVLESMNEAQEIINNWDEEDTEESPEYAQALGEVMMTKRLFLKLVRDYERLEDARAYSMRDALERSRPGAYGYNGGASRVDKQTVRVSFSSVQSYRRDGDRRDIPHPRQFKGYSYTTNRPSFSTTTLPKDWKIF